MRDTVQIVCPGCGNLFDLPVALVHETLNCNFCGKSIRILQHSSVRLQAVEAESVEPTVNASAAVSGQYGNVNQPASTSGTVLEESAPAVDSIAAASVEQAAFANPEEEMVDTASKAFQSKGWPCEGWSGHKAFTAQVKVPSAKRGVEETINLTVSAASGALCLETVVAPLPKPPFTSLREILHRINVRAGGSFIQIRECGVSARFHLFPRRTAGGKVSQAEVLRALYQLNQDRVNAGPLLQKEEEIRARTISALVIDQAFSAPMYSGLSSGLNAAQLREMATKAEYTVNIKGAMLYLAADPKRADVYSVWLSLSNQVVRGWTIPGSAIPGRNPSVSWFRRIIGNAEPPPPPKLSKPQFETLLKKLDALNESASPLRFIWNGQQVLGMTVFPITDKRMELEDFKEFVDLLVERARETLPELKGTPLENVQAASM